MRKATNVAAMAGDVGPSTPGQDNLIALKMTFDYPDPVKAQEVLQSFVNSFLRMDSDTVEDQASLGVQFLQDQAQKLQAQIQPLEQQITDLKGRNGSAFLTSAATAVAKILFTIDSVSAQCAHSENATPHLQR